VPATTVLVADAQRLFAEALAMALRGQRDLEVFDAHPTDGHDAVRSVMRLKPDVAVLDLWMPGMSGPAAARAISTWSAETKVLILSWFHGPVQVQEALAAGVIGFLPKGVRVAQVAEAIRRAARGEAVVYAEELFEMVDGINRRARLGEGRWDRLMTLSSREVEILQKLSTGRPAKQAARELSIAMGTLKNHIHNILVKTGAETKLEAINMARAVGLVGELEQPPAEA